MRKPHARSVLKTLDAATQARIADWCAQDSLESAVARCASELGIKTNRSSLGEFVQWWQLREHFERANNAAKAAEDLMAKVDPAASAEKLRAFGQLMFVQKAIESENSEDFVGLMKADVLNRTLAAKAEGFRLQYEQKERELELARQKFQRDSCKLFLKWFSDEQAKQIATGSGTNSDKIQALGKAMFGEDWDE